ncbi:E3 SUMO-protein ligase RanBP2-like [Anneissia japonica]|uniref:E3 SUMO-protein ligase RanBP2-like n=1 Tax=Anneissia japonica TaxID=1529436 RepID=UPI001425B07F|nr:E3 SUMO-protein ligase RanBP2-like [Anneissia japonica]
MSEDEKSEPSTASSPAKASVRSSDQGYYPEEERDDLQFEPVVTLKEIEVKTGEEEEEQLFCQRAKLYRWNRETAQWKERGVGEIKILKHKVLNRCRVVMRRDQVLKICANHIITPEMELKPNAGSDRSLVWNAMDASDMEPQLEQLAVKFKTPAITAGFKAVFEKCQGS